MMMDELNDIEIAALIALRKKMKDGVFKHTKNKGIYHEPYIMEENGRRWKSHAKFFDMNLAYVECTCGTVACIGGWFLLELGRKINHDTLFDFAVKRTQFFCLCYGDAVGFGKRFANATPEQAVKAIDNYMFGPEGEPIWGHLLLTPAVEQATVTA